MTKLIMTLKNAALSLFVLSLAACTSAPISNSNQPTTVENTSPDAPFIYTNPNGKAIDLGTMPFKTNGMVRTQDPDVLGVGGTTHKYTRFGGWNSRNGQADVFVVARNPSKSVTLEGDQIYYGRALRSIQQSVFDNRLTFSLNFDKKTFVGFSVSVPDPRTFGSTLLLKGQINGTTIEGTVESGKNTGKFTAQFYGENGIELAGIARFSNPSLDFAFGGDRQ